MQKTLLHSCKAQSTLIQSSNHLKSRSFSSISEKHSTTNRSNHAYSCVFFAILRLTPLMRTAAESHENNILL
jgi:hypothetical protein